MFYPVWDNLLVLAEFFCATNCPINPCLKYVLFSSRPFGVLDKFLMSFTGCSSSIQEAVISEEMRGMKAYQREREEDGKKWLHQGLVLPLGGLIYLNRSSGRWHLSLRSCTNERSRVFFVRFRLGHFNASQVQQPLF